jgi:uncharacterized protein (TIGR03435 family)
MKLTGADGKLGPQVRPSTGECLGPFAPEAEAVESVPPQCPFRFENGIVEAGGVTMADVARLLARFTDLTPNGPIVDQTGLQGTFAEGVTEG